MRVAYSTTVGSGGAPWVRILFGNFDLGESSIIRMTSLENDDQQHFDAESIEAWDHASAIFRGGSVKIELLVAPFDEGIFFETMLLTVGEQVGGDIGGPIVSLCDGDDDRAPSSDGRVGRLFMGGCTAWIVSNGALLSAGHCNPFGSVVEFNVPASQSDGTPVPAVVEDQYPIDSRYVAWWDDGENQIGRDWAVFSIGRNSETNLRASDVQGFFRCTNNTPAVNASLRITGFGVDSSPPSRNYVQQTDTGTYEGEDSDSDGIWLRHRADTQPANSGSPMIWEAQGITIGIHTNGGCDADPDSWNSGTSFELNELENFINGFWGNAVEQVDKSHPFASPSNGSLLRPWTTVASGVAAVATNGVLLVVQGTYSETPTITKAMTIQAPVGGVVIGQ